MTATVVDLAALEYSQGPRIKLAGATAVTDAGGTGAEFGGTEDVPFTEFEQLFCAAYVSRIASGATLTIEIQGRDDDMDTWSTLATITTTTKGMTSIERLESPKARLRAIWDITSAKTATFQYISASPFFMLPDSAGASEGDVLTLDANLNPTWATP